MLADRLVLLFLLNSCFLGSEAAQCDLFHRGLVCSLDPFTNIVGTVFDLKSELDCQQECASNSDCNYFMFTTFTNNRPSDCFLLTECKTNTTSCENTPDCSLSITGPKTPSITEACCGEFQDVICEGESEIGHFYGAAEAAECQSLCRDTSGCRYWSLFGDVCFLYSACTTPNPCSSTCTSGSLFPDVSSCDIFDTLLLGGETSSEGYSTSVELISANATCSPQMDRLPVARRFARAAMLGSRILHCGGLNGQFQRSCHSYDLALEGGRWQDEASMVMERDSFGLSAIGEMIFASGGRGNEGSLSSTEVFTLEDGWRLESKLEMVATKDSHCSVAIGSWLYTIGGSVGGTTLDYVSNIVEAIDTSLLDTNDPITWLKKANMIEKRWSHGCHVGVFERQEGIFVAGGKDDRGLLLASAEFYNPATDMWQPIGSLNTARAYFPMTKLGKQLIVSGGGDDPINGVETWNGTNWDLELDNLKVGRTYHTAVSIKAGKLSCI